MDGIRRDSVRVQDLKEMGLNLKAKSQKLGNVFGTRMGFRGYKDEMGANKLMIGVSELSRSG